MCYISKIKSILFHYDYTNFSVEKVGGISFIRVYVCPERASITKTLLMSLLSIDGLDLVGIDFDKRYLLFSY